MSKKNDKEYNRKKSLDSLNRARAVGVKRSADEPSQKDEVEFDLSRCISIEIPWSTSLSKNNLFGRGAQHKRVYMKEESKTVREQIAWLVKEQMLKHKIEFVTGKIWLDIFVQKPDAGAGDAINVLDLIADSIEDAVGINDKWFCIKGIDWEIKKENPMIYIEVGQGSHEPQHICSYCGIIQNVSNFTKQKRGYSRMCCHCRKR